MKLPKFLSIIGLVTLFSILYVYQQTEVVRLAYSGQKRVSILEDLLDKNSLLRYNLGKRISLVNIAEKISDADDFQMPDAYRLVKLSSKTRLRLSIQSEKGEGLVSRIFGIKREAEAKTLKP